MTLPAVNYLDRVRARREDDPAGSIEFEDALSRDQLLVEMIEARGETAQSGIAHRMGTTQSAVSDLEKGKQDPRLTTLRRYAQAVGRGLQIHLGAEPKLTDSEAEIVGDPLCVGEDIS